MITATNTFATSIGPFVNIINGNAFILLGGGIAFAINKLAHQIFSVQKNSHASTVIRAVAFLAGAGACYLIAPGAAFFSVSLVNATIMAISAVFYTLILKKVEDKQLSQRLTPGSYQPDYLVYVIGGMAASLPIVGLFGRVGLVALGVGGALAGAYLSDNF